MAKFSTRTKSPLTLFFCKGGETRYIKFEPANVQGRISSAEYFTRDKEIIDFLKSHPMMGSGIFLEEDEPAQEVVEVAEEPKMEEVVVKTAEEEAAEHASSDDSDKYRALCSDKAKVEEVPAVCSIATAKSVLQMRFGYTARNKKASEIKEDAAKLYNVVFPNWK